MGSINVWLGFGELVGVECGNFKILLVTKIVRLKSWLGARKRLTTNDMRWYHKSIISNT